MTFAREHVLLYAVTDRAWLNRAPAGFDTLERQIEEAISGGATLVQLREKELDDAAFLDLAQRVKRVTDTYGVPLIINDNLYVTLTSGAAGLHIGQSDGEAGALRRLLGPRKILGVSVQTVAQAVSAQAAGADYLGVGAVFPTSTKADAADVSRAALTAICAAVRLPVVAIGGIQCANVGALEGTGIAGIAVVSALFGRPERVREAAIELKKFAQKVCLA